MPEAWINHDWKGTIIIASPANIPSGKHTKNYGRSPFLMGKSIISMAIFNSYVKLPEGTYCNPIDG